MCKGSSMEPSTPIVGRESELEFLMDRMSSALSGQGGLVLVSGEAGPLTHCSTSLGSTAGPVLVPIIATRHMGGP